MVDEVAARVLQHEDLACGVGRAMWPDDADHFRLALLHPHLLEQRLLPDESVAGWLRAGCGKLACCESGCGRPAGGVGMAGGA